MGGGERHPQPRGREQHDDIPAPCRRGEVFGVPAERDAGLIDYRLVDRPGNHGGEAAIETAADGPIQGIKHIARIGGIRSAAG